MRHSPVGRLARLPGGPRPSVVTRRDLNAFGSITPCPNWVQYIPLVLIVLAFWFLVLRPARNRQKEFMATQSALTPGARVMLASGIFGELVVGRATTTVELRVAPDVVLTAARQAVAKVIVPQDASPATTRPIRPEPDD